MVKRSPAPPSGCRHSEARLGAAAAGPQLRGPGCLLQSISHLLMIALLGSEQAAKEVGSRRLRRAAIMLPSRRCMSSTIGFCQDCASLLWHRQAKPSSRFAQRR